MSDAVSEILKQAEKLSADEQVELATRLMEQAQRIAEASSQLRAEEGVSDNDEEEDWRDNLKLMPPKWTYTAQARFYYAGRGKPSRYDFSDIFDDDVSDDGGE